MSRAAQSEGGQDKPQYVGVPTETVLVAMAAQPHCPLRIEEARYLLKADGNGYLIEYTVRNQSAKPISYFTVVAWGPSGGGTLRNTLVDSNKLLLPGQSLKSTREGEDYTLVPMNDTHKLRLKPDGEARGFYILLVDVVEFADGSTYRDEKTSHALLKFLDKFEF